MSFFNSFILVLISNYYLQIISVYLSSEDSACAGHLELEISTVILFRKPLIDLWIRILWNRSAKQMALKEEVKKMFVSCFIRLILPVQMLKSSYMIQSSWMNSWNYPWNCPEGDLLFPILHTVCQEVPAHSSSSGNPPLIRFKIRGN